MEKDLWLHDKNGNELINLKGCVNVFKNTKNVAYDKPYLLRFLYIGRGGNDISIWYENQSDRDNMYDHVVSFLKPYQIDTNEKPLTL